MTSTNSKEVSKKIQEHILSNFDSYGDMMDELRNYQKNYGGTFGKTFAQEGNLLVYESEVDKFFQDVLKQTPEEQGKYSPKKTWELYTNLVQREAAHIVSEDGRCYIKPESVKQEKPMSDLNEEQAEEKNLSPRELAFRNTAYQRDMVCAALKNGTLCCLPGKDGYADTAPATNLMDQSTYMGDTQLYLKEHQKKGGFPTAEYLTQEQIEKAREDVPGLSIVKGQKGVSIHYSKLNGETGEWDEKHIRLFNVDQLNSPDKLKKMMEEKSLQYSQAQYYKKTQPPEPGRKAEGPEITCSSSDPVKYLGQYFAALHEGVPFKADRKTAKEFARNMGDALFAQGIRKNGEPMASPKTGEPVTDPFDLSRICREANKYRKEFTAELRRQQGRFFLGARGDTGTQETNSPNDNKPFTNPAKAPRQTDDKPSDIEAAKKAGYVQGVCECVAAIGNDYALGKKLLAEMGVTKKTARECANPETFKALESGVFAQKQEQKLEYRQGRGHKR